MRRFLVLAATALVAALSIPVGSASAFGITTVTLAGGGTGTVTSSPAGIACSNVPGATQTTCDHDWGFSFDPVELTATPGPGSAFLGWSGNAGGTCVGATNPCSTTRLFDFTAVATFEPAPAAPVVSTGGASEVAFPSASVAGTVNPGSSLFPVTGCYVEYGLTTDYGERVLCRPRTVAPGTAPVALNASLGVLDANTTYHYRFVATNAGATGRGEDRTLTSGSAPADSCPNAAIRAKQGALAQRLPRCGAYELVSPPFSAGQKVGLFVGTADGTRAVLDSVGGFAGTEGLPTLGAQYAAERTASGWKASAIIPPASKIPAVGFLGLGGMTDVTRDGSRSLWFGNLKADEGTTRFTPIVRESDGSLHAAGPTQDDSLEPAGASEDLRTVVQRTTTRLPLTDGTTDSRNASALSLYASTRGTDGRATVRQVAYRAGATMFGADCNVELGGADRNGGSAFGRNAVSQDGQKIFFTAGCQGSPAEDSRVWAKIGAADPADLSASQCAATCGPAAPAQFRGASRDGSRVYFATEQRLLPEDEDTSNHLYEYDFNATGQKLRLVTGGTADEGAGVAPYSMFGVSEDGAYVYFVATGALTTSSNARGVSPQPGDMNLYVYHRTAGQATGTTQFVGALTSLNDLTLQLSSDGRYAAFLTPADLTGGRLAGDAYNDLYRYDAQSDELLRVWTSDPAHNGTARSDGALIERAIVGLGGARARYSAGGWNDRLTLSDDGSLVGFTTAEPLSREDHNDSNDAYLWDAPTGRFTMLTDGTSKPRSKYDSGSSFVGMTPSGDSLFVRSGSPLLAEHTSGQVASYVIRKDGGFPVPAVPAVPCSGDDCQPPTSPPSGPSDAAGSSTFVGPGNLLLGASKSLATVRVGKVKPVRGSSARLSVRVSGKGKVQVSGASLVRTSVSVGKAGSFRIAAKLSQSGQRALRRKHRVTTRATVRFVPASGKAVTARVSVTFTATAKKRKAAMSSRPAGRVSVLSSDIQKGR